jgi:hypothetical protein
VGRELQRNVSIVSIASSFGADAMPMDMNPESVNEDNHGASSSDPALPRDAGWKEEYALFVGVLDHVEDMPPVAPAQQHRQAAAMKRPAAAGALHAAQTNINDATVSCMGLSSACLHVEYATWQVQSSPPSELLPSELCLVKLPRPKS